MSKRSTKGLATEVVGACVAAVTLAAAIFASQQHPADDITLNATGVSSIAVRGTAAAAFFAYAKSILLTASSGQVDVELPVPPSDCSLLPSDCLGGRLVADQPVTSVWTAPRSIEADNASGSEIHLAALPQERGGGISFSVTGQAPLRVCVGPAGDSSALALRIGDASVTFPVPTVATACGTGLVVSFREAVQSTTSGLILQGLTALRTTVHGESLTLSFDKLRLTFHSTASDATYDGGGGVEIDSDHAFDFTAGGVPPALTATDQPVYSASHAWESGVERLSNAYNHYTWMSYALTALGALVTLFLWRWSR